MVMSTSPARPAKPVSALPRRETALRISPTPQAWRRSQTSCPNSGLYQIEYSRNLVFTVGGHLEQVFHALIDRSRAPLDLRTIKTILGYKRRPKYRPRNKPAAEWEVTLERPTYDLDRKSVV